MFWVLMALLVVAGGVLLRRRQPTGEDREPWRASLREEEEEDEPLDLEEIRRAEDEWLAEEAWAEEDWQDDPDDESWR